MPNSANQSHYSSVLTDISVNFNAPELKARDLLRPVKVTHENDVYPVYSKDAFDLEHDVRADGGEANETDIGWKYVPYQCAEHALRTPLTKRQLDNADDPRDLEARKTENVKQKVLNILENAVFGTGGFARSSANVINTRNLDWTNPATASPRADTDLLKEDVETACGHTPDTIVLTPRVARAIMKTAEWRDEAKYTNDLRSDNDIPSQFYGLEVVLVESLQNTGRKGQPKSLTRLMGDDILVCYRGAGQLGPNSLTWASMLYTEEYALKWWEDSRRCWLIEYGYIYTLQLVAKECAALGGSVLTP